MVPTLFEANNRDPLVSSDYWFTTFKDILYPEKQYAESYEDESDATSSSSSSPCDRCVSYVSTTGYSTDKELCSPCKVVLCTRIEQEHDYSSTKPAIKVEPKDEDDFLPAKEEIYGEFTSFSPYKIKKGYSWDYFSFDKPIKQEDITYEDSESKPEPKQALYADRYFARTRKEVCYNLDKLGKPSSQPVSPERKPKLKRGRPPKHKPAAQQSLPHKSVKKSRTMVLPPPVPVLKRERSKSKGRKHGVFKSTAKREEHNQMERNRRQALSRHNADLRDVIPQAWFGKDGKARATGPSRQKVLDTATLYIRKFQKLSILDTGFRDNSLPNLLQHMKVLKSKLAPVINHKLQRLVC